MQLIIFCFLSQSSNTIFTRRPNINGDSFICIICGLETDFKLIAGECHLAALLGERMEELAIVIDDVDVNVLGILCVDLEFEMD